MIEIFVDTSTWGHWFAWQDGTSFLNLNSKIQEDVEAFDQIYHLVSSQPEKFIFLYNARVYDPRTGHAELPIEYFERFEQIKSANIIRRIPIPCTRADGHFLGDGSILFGGEFGGSLRGLLSIHDEHEERLAQHWPDFKKSEVFSEKTRFMIREFSLTNLREKGVPDEILQTLHCLKDRMKEGKRKFLEALQDTIGTHQADTFKDLIFRYAFYDTTPRKEEYDVEHLESALEAKADFFLTDDYTLIDYRVKLSADIYQTSADQQAKEICMRPAEALPRLQTL